MKNELSVDKVMMQPIDNPKDLRMILLNAIKMQSLYSGGKVKYVETSSATH